jgi:hypothetical protein
MIRPVSPHLRRGTMPETSMRSLCLWSCFSESRNRPWQVLAHLGIQLRRFSLTLAAERWAE